MLIFICRHTSEAQLLLCLPVPIGSTENAAAGLVLVLVVLVLVVLVLVVLILSVLLMYKKEESGRSEWGGVGGQ